jgi:hypothetical protein
MLYVHCPSCLKPQLKIWCHFDPCLLGTAIFGHVHRSRVRVLGLLTREDGTDTLSRNVGKQLPHDAM